MFIMKVFYQIVQSLKNFIVEIGEMSYFSIRFLKEFYKKPYEFQEFLKQCYSIGNRSLFLVSVTGFIIGLVFTLQTRPTLMEFGAVSWMPSMVSISIIREIGPIITGLICAGKIGSGIGAEIGSMRTKRNTNLATPQKAPIQKSIEAEIIEENPNQGVFNFWDDSPNVIEYTKEEGLS